MLLLCDYTLYHCVCLFVCVVHLSNLQDVLTIYNIVTLPPTGLNEMLLYQN